MTLADKLQAHVNDHMAVAAAKAKSKQSAAAIVTKADGEDDSDILANMHSRTLTGPGVVVGNYNGQPICFTHDGDFPPAENPTPAVSQ